MNRMFFKEATNFFFTFLLFLPLFAAGQLDISFPAERAVFQRDNNNIGGVIVNGTVINNADVVEGRLVPVASWQGQLTDWQVIDTDITDGAYSGKVSGIGGWYQLQIRARKNGETLFIKTVDKVGIGEVFIVAGQSNAQGFTVKGLLAFNTKGAADDRVNGYGYYQKTELEENPPLTDISRLSKELNIGPHGQSAWAWGELGDLIVAKFNVPVLFFNAAYEGTTIENWANSAKGIDTRLIVLQNSISTNNAPYSYLRIILQNHVPVYGLRSILWMQGENDSNTTKASYKKDLDFLVKQASKDIGKNLSWMVSRTSYVFNQTFLQIIQAQEEVIRENAHVFEGPLTDYLQNPRSDGVHFTNEGSNRGISNLANAFNTSLNAEVVSQMTPVLSEPIEKLSHKCLTGGFVEVSVTKKYQTLKWNNGSSSTKIQIESGSVSAIVRDDNGNYHLTERLVYDNINPAVPEILALEDGVACIGDSVEFFVDREDLSVEWADGSSNRTFRAFDTDPVKAFYKDANGCKSGFSLARSAEFSPKPNAPTIESITGTFGACDGEAIGLRVSGETVSYEWSTGETSRDILVSGIGESEITAFGISSKGCESELSAPVLVKLFAKPTPPSIDKTGPYSLGVVNLGEYFNYEWFFENQNLPLETASSILAAQDGFYAIKGFEFHEAPFEATCLSNLSGQVLYKRAASEGGVVVFPNPIQNGEFYLTADRKLDVVISMQNIQGQKVIERQTISELDVPRNVKVGKEIAAGFYLLRVEYEGLQRVFRLLFE